MPRFEVKNLNMDFFEAMLIAWCNAGNPRGYDFAAFYCNAPV